MQPSKWDLILDRKPVPILDHLVEEIAKLFARDLAVWPPAIDELDDATGRQVAALLKDSPARPPLALYRQAFVLTRMDLAREADALDDYLRNQRWLTGGLAAKDKGMLLFLSRFMAEQLLALGEYTQGRVNRARMLDVLERTERHFASWISQ